MIDAAGRGTGEGLHLALNVGAMLISFLALIALRQRAASASSHLSLQQIFGWVFAPVAWAMGVPWRDAPTIGNLLGTRMALNEFVAYSQLGPLKATLDPQVVHDRDLRAVRLRQLQLDRHPDRRHRRAGAEPPPRSGAPRPARDVRRHAGELHDRDDRRVPAVTATSRSQTRTTQLTTRVHILTTPILRLDPCTCRLLRPGRSRPPTSSARASATCRDRGRPRLRPRRFRRPLERRRVDALRRAAALAGVARRRPRRAAGRRDASRGRHDRGAGGPLPRLRRARPAGP